MNRDTNKVIITIVAVFIAFNLLKVVTFLIKPIVLIGLLLIVISTVTDRTVKEIVMELLNTIKRLTNR